MWVKDVLFICASKVSVGVGGGAGGGGAGWAFCGCGRGGGAGVCMGGKGLGFMDAHQRFGFYGMAHVRACMRHIIHTCVTYMQTP